MKGRSLVLSSAVSLSLIFDAYTFRKMYITFYNLTSSRMVEVEKLCKKILFIINLRRIKQITRDKCSSKGGLQPPQPLPWIRLCISYSIRQELYLALYSARTLSRTLFGTHFISPSIRRALYLALYVSLYSARTIFGTHSISHSMSHYIRHTLFSTHSNRQALYLAL